jgi:membrane associated rhomboid family serine protease
MLLFPLGLKARTKQFPVVTVLITLATVVLSVPHFAKLHQYQKSYLESLRDAYQARAELLLKSCSQTTLTSEECEFLKENLSADKPANVVAEVSRLQQKSNERFGKEGNEKLKNITAYLNDDKKWKKLEQDFDGNPAFLAFSEAKARYEAEFVAAQGKYNLLSNGNINLKSVFLAQWTHGGWMHLLGNMVFFVLIAIPVEQRLGSIFFAMLYMLGGTFGLGLQVFAYDNPAKYLVGASANVSAVAGAFLILFRTLEMRIWFSAFMLYNRIVYIPTLVFIPFFVVLSDITGAVSRSNGIAHVAHLVGFGVGATIAWLHTKRKPLAPGFAFHFEYALAQKAQTASEPIAKLQALWELLFYHADNVTAQCEAVETVLQLPARNWEQLPKPAVRVLRKHFGSVFAHYLKKSDHDELFHLMMRVPHDWPLQKLTQRMNPSELRHAAEAAAAKGRVETALRLYELYSVSAPARARSLVQPTIAELTRRLNDAKAS